MKNSSLSTKNSVTGSCKKILALICFMFVFSFAKAQMICISDSMFRLELTNLGYGPCMTGDSINSGCSLVTFTTVLNVLSADIYDLQGIQAFGNLQFLYCSSDSLANIPALPGSLTFLYCSGNQLSSLPALPGSLTSLDCSGNQLTSLPALPGSLTFLGCSGNQLTNLPALPGSLTQLYCSSNLLTSLPALPGSLIELDCSHNQLTNLFTLPGSLAALYCGDNQLSTIPVLPGSLTYLSCFTNQLANLPVLPGSLIQLYCGDNQLMSIPVLPASLTYFSCDNNQLTNLPALPGSLISLDCSGNQLTILPALPGPLTTLECSTNQLTNIPELPDSLYDFTCGFNPNLSCLPQLKRIVNLGFSNTSVSCLPNYGNVTNSTPLLSSLPLCGLFNPNSCSSFYNITGKSYFDENMNCQFDSADVPEQNVHIMLYKNGSLVQEAFTGSEGFYSFDVHDSAGAYIVLLDTVNLPFSVLCPASITYNDTITATDSLFYNNDFALTDYSTVGIAQVEKNDFRFSVFPNPANDYFTVRVVSSLNKKYLLIIKDITGREVETIENTGISENIHFGYHLAGGIYFAEVVMGDFRRVMKVIKSK